MFLIIYFFVCVSSRTKKVIQVWNDIRVSKWWQHFWLNYSFNINSSPLPLLSLQESGSLNLWRCWQTADMLLWASTIGYIMWREQERGICDYINSRTYAIQPALIHKTGKDIWNQTGVGLILRFKGYTTAPIFHKCSAITFYSDHLSKKSFRFKIDLLF